MSFAIVTDTSANLPSSYLLENHISVIPFSYFVGGETEGTCLNTGDFDGKAYYDAMRAGTPVTTAQINPQRYIDYLSPLLDAGADILFVGMSSGISGANSAANIASVTLLEEYPQRKICIVDTLAASLGEGIQVIKAVELRKEGKTLEEIQAYLLEMRKRIYQVFTVDDLAYLKRGGRISNAAAVIGTVLQIKPILKGNEFGQIIATAKVRGRKKSIQALAEKYDTLVRNAESQVVGIAHADCDEDADALIAMLQASHPAKEFLKVVYEPVTGSHVGPGTLALFFEGSSDVRFQ